MNLYNLKIFIALLFSTMTLLGCSQKKETAPSPLVDKAIAIASDAARQLVETDHSDTLALQNSILDARARLTEFQVAADTAAVNAYNRTFKQFLQENDPALAKDIFIERPKDLPDDEQWDEFEEWVEIKNKK